MSVSGVICQKAVVDAYCKFQTSGVKETYDFMIMKIEKGEIMLEEYPDFGKCAEEAGSERTDGVPASYVRLFKLLKDGGCRYAFYTFKWEEQIAGGSTKQEKSKIVLIQYVSDNHPHPRDKLLYPTSVKALLKGCKGSPHIIEANDEDEIGYQEILKGLSKGKHVKQC